MAFMYRSSIGDERRLCCFRHLIRFETTGAHSQSLGLPIDICPDFLEVGHPSASCPVVRMTDVVAAGGTFPANIANSCHGDLPEVFLEENNLRKKLHTCNAAHDYTLLKFMVSFRTISNACLGN